MLNKNYSFLSQMFHHLVLGSNIVQEMLFDLEKIFFKKKIKNDNLKQHIFISGLSRSGTTALMRYIYETNLFASLTYRDMPFITSPNLWNKILGNKTTSSVSKVRAHKDGIQVNIGSPEALDEVFWRVKLNNNYIHSDKLVIHEVNEEVINEFRKFVSLILYRYKKNLYLSKNNNNLLRLESIIKAFPNCLILIPFRNPVEQANSLLLQHQNFTEMQTKNKFVRSYMSYLVHYEFGIDDRYYEFIKNDNIKYNKNSISYWLTKWINTYTYLSQEKFVKKNNILYLNYDYFCENPQKVLKNLFKKINLDSLSFDSSFKIKKTLKKVDISEDAIILKSQDIFNKLKILNNNCFD